MKRMRVSGIIVCALVVFGSVMVSMAPAWGQIPTESDVYVDRGIVAYDQRQFQEALQAFQEAIRLNPNNVNALYYVGLTYMAVDQPAAAQETLEQALKLAPTDPDVIFQLAVAYFTQQQYDKADPLFRQLYQREPKRPNIGYYLGFLEYRNQRYREALRFFQGNVASDANYAQLNSFYSSLALSALGLPAQAQAEVEEAIRLQPMSPLTAPAERFREVLGEATKAERNFKVDAKVSLFYDNNVAVIANQSTDPAASLTRNQPHASWGQLGYVRFEYTGLRTPDWEGSIAGSLLGTYDDNVPKYNVFSPSASGSLNYKSTLWDKPVVYNLTALYDYMTLGSESYLYQYTVAPAMSIVWNATHLTQPVLRYRYQFFYGEQNLSTSADNRTGSNYMLGFLHFIRFEGDQHYLRMGYQLDREATEGSNWSYLGNRFIVGGQYTVPQVETMNFLSGIRLRLDIDFQWRNYRNQNTYLPLGNAPSIYRDDRELNIPVSISKDLPYNLTLSLENLFTWNYSNIPTYKYTRNVISLSLSWRY